MNRRAAEELQKFTKSLWWIENPRWEAGNPASRLVCRAARALPFSLYEPTMRALFADHVIAVSGESVVAANGTDEVDKFMLRYPRELSLEAFRDGATREVAAVSKYLGSVAIPTEVSIKPAKVFRYDRNPVLAVTQTQPRLDLEVNPPLSLEALYTEDSSPLRDKTARDLETLVVGSHELAALHGLHPDVAASADNLRRSVLEGTITLIDVMPIYDNGTRLIGDRPPDLLENSQAALQEYEAFIGQYGR